MTKIIRKLGFGDKETTMYVDSIVHKCNLPINVVFVNLLLKKHHLLSEIKSWMPFHESRVWRWKSVPPDNC
jgi:hypothetical protein